MVRCGIDVISLGLSGLGKEIERLAVRLVEPGGRGGFVEVRAEGGGPERLEALQIRRGDGAEGN